MTILKNPRPTKAELEQLYVKDKISIRKIGKMFNVSKRVIRDLLVVNGIKIAEKHISNFGPWEPPKSIPKPSSEELEQYYVKEGKSIQTIANSLHVGYVPIRNLLVEYGLLIPRIPPKPLPSKAKLEQLYVKDKIGYRAIAKMFHVGGIVIRDLLVKYGFEISRQGERMQKLNPRPTKAELEQLYVKDKIGYSAIAKMFHVGGIVIRDLLVKYGFEIQGPERTGRSPWNKNTKGLMPIPKNKGKKMPDWVIENMKQGNVGRPSNRKGATLTESTKEKIKDKRQHQKNVSESSHEKLMQKLLDGIGIEYVTHKGVLRAQPDIFIEPNICIFFDGDYWHFNPKPHIVRKQHRLGYKPNDKGYGEWKYVKDKWASDKKIRQRLKKNGYTVLTFWESEIEKDAQKCLQTILKTIKA